MLTNSEIKQIRSLSEKKFREMTGLFVVEGEKMVSEAMKSRYKIEKIYYREEIGDATMKRISSLASPPPVLAVVRKPDNITISERDINERIKLEAGLYLVLDNLKDPGNLGTIIRLADWFGIKAVFASPESVEIFNPKTVQATMGAIFRVNFHYTDIVSLCNSVVSDKGNVYGTFLDGDNIYRQELAPGTDSPSVIVIGNESTGISKEVARTVTGRLFIPSFPQGMTGSESLNAAIATAITVAEFRRRLYI